MSHPFDDWRETLQQDHAWYRLRKTANPYVVQYPHVTFRNGNGQDSGDDEPEIIWTFATRDSHAKRTMTWLNLTGELKKLGIEFVAGLALRQGETEVEDSLYILYIPADDQEKLVALARLIVAQEWQTEAEVMSAIVPQISYHAALGESTNRLRVELPHEAVLLDAYANHDTVHSFWERKHWVIEIEDPEIISRITSSRFSFSDLVSSDPEADFALGTKAWGTPNEQAVLFISAPIESEAIYAIANFLEMECGVDMKNILEGFGPHDDLKDVFSQQRHVGVMG